MNEFGLSPLLKLSIFLSYIVYHSREEIELLNKHSKLRPDTPLEWVKIWEDVKSMIHEDSIHIFDCEKYGIGDSKFIWVIDMEDRLWVSFRGTKSASDILTDITTSKEKLIDVCYSPYYLKTCHNGIIPWVHHGFYSLFCIFKYELDHIYRKHISHCNHIIFTGHSLGGALSSLAAMCAYTSRYAPELKLTNITFGSPKIGNYGFAKIYNEWITDNVHYYNSRDPIPYFPTFPQQYYSIGNQIQVDINESRLRLFSIQNHNLLFYLRRIEKNFIKSANYIELSKNQPCEIKQQDQQDQQE